MLETLLKIGEWQAQRMQPIDKFLDKPKLKENITYYIGNLIFDLDARDIYLELYKELDTEKDLRKLKILKIKGGNNKSFYAGALADKINNVLKTFFGSLKPDEWEEKAKGELLEILEKMPELKEQISGFVDLLIEINGLKDVLKEKIQTEEGEFSTKKILESLSLPKKEKLGVLMTSVKSNDLGNEPVPIASMEDYEKFLEEYLLKSDRQDEYGDEKLCYVSGEIKDDVREFKTEERYNLAKMFVTTTINYATGFNGKNYYKNFQASETYQQYIELGAKYLLENYKIRIAGVDHVLVPVFLSKTLDDGIDFDIILDKIRRRSELIFNHQDLEHLDQSIQDETDDLYWINYLGFESDGNSFKTINLIKDVSTPWLIEIIQDLKNLSVEFNTRYTRVGEVPYYNFYTFYRYIPVRKDTNKNDALEMFKDILEYRSIEKDLLFKHFTKYLIAQKSGQFDQQKKHRSFPNIRQVDNFDYAIANAVKVYLFFLNFLRRQGLLEEKNNDFPTEKSVIMSNNTYSQRIEEFFKDMHYTDRQKGLFFLGRLLDQIAYAQYKSNHTTKPVLNKINYNGMDRDAIMRLFLDLEEKTRQYATKINLKAAEYNAANFVKYFNPNEPDSMTPEENVFFILSGYAFGLISGDKEEQEEEQPTEIEQ